MRTMRLLAAAVIAVGTATALAAPASADDHVDQAFLNAVRGKGVPIESDAAALELAHMTCDLLNDGKTPAEALRHIQKETEWSDTDALNFGGLAAYAYCRDKLPQ
jgi:hypothetical protein